MPIKNVLDNNRVHNAIKKAYKTGWEHERFNSPRWNVSMFREMLTELFHDEISGHVDHVVKAYSDGSEASNLFDDRKEHGAIEMPFDNWISLMDDESALNGYIDEKAANYASSKYRCICKEHYSRPGIEIKLGEGRSLFYHGPLSKGDVVQSGYDYIRISSVEGFEASGDMIGQVRDVSRVSSRHAKVVTPKEREPYLVEGKDVGSLDADQIESDFKNIMAEMEKEKVADKATQKAVSDVTRRKGKRKKIVRAKGKKATKVKAKGKKATKVKAKR